MLSPPWARLCSLKKVLQPSIPLPIAMVLRD
jgi:hypothetical protein